MNKLLERQIGEHFGKVGLLPENFRRLLEAISDSYDRYEEEQKTITRSAPPPSYKLMERDSELEKEEENLKKRYQDMTTLFADIDEVLYSADMVNYKLTQISAGCEKVYGYTTAEFMADDDLWQRLVHPEDKHIAEKHVQWLFEGRQVLNQYRIISKDGTIRWVENKIMPVLDPTGQLVRINGVSSDITGRKQAEEESEKSFSLLEATLEATADGILVVDTEARVVRLNNKFIALWRVPQEVLNAADAELGISYVSDQLVHPEEFISKIRELNNRQKEISFDILHFKDGRIFERYSQPQLIKEKYVGRVWSFRDITEKKTAELDLIRRETQLAIAAQMAKLGYWEFDVLNGLFTFTDQFYAIFKTTAEKAGGYSMTPEQYTLAFVYPDDQEIVGKGVAQAINSSDEHFSHEFEHRIVYADGEMGYISVHFYIVKDDKGRTVKTFGVNQDITDRKRGEESLRNSESNLELKNRELELKNKELEQFAYVASHDLQEPLRTTSNFAEMLSQQYKGRLDENADKYLHFITDSSRRMKALIKDLLDYARIGNKEELEKVDCNKILQDVMADLEVAIRETKAEIHPDSLPVLNGYPTEIKQLFQNLIINAIKFRKKDSIPRIDILAVRDDDCWTFAVRDNGIGIEKEHQERIFDIFQRLHTRTEYEGSGIGLAYCKKIVSLHGGKIWVESTPGEGATFYFTIPETNTF